MPDVSLVINGTEFVGWESVSVTRALSAVSGSFSLELTDRWEQGSDPVPVFPEQSCQLLLDGEPVITGFVDDVEPSFSSGSRSMRVSGRDRTKDLVDCSVMHSPGELRGQDLAGIARALCKPFSIEVVTIGSVGRAFDVFKFEPGETAFEALDRACRQRGVLARSDARGRLVLGEVGQGRADALIEGRNLLSGSAPRDGRERFSKYVVVGQCQGSDTVSGVAACGVRAEATDAAVSRYRPLQIIAETQATPDSARERAGWEANVRAAKSSTVNAVVQGWRMEDGRLWTVGDLARVESPSLWVDRDLVITSVRFSLGASGTTTVLELCRQDAFARKPGADKTVASALDLTMDLSKAVTSVSKLGWGR